MASCGDGHRKVYPVQGKILVNGQPAVGAVVMFYPEKDQSLEAIHPVGKVGEDGSFTLCSFGDGDGAPPGAYIVTVTWPDLSRRSSKTGGIPQKGDHPDRLKGRYSSAAHSPLRARVQEEKNSLPPFELR
jgi:hypothetical protein